MQTQATPKAAYSIAEAVRVTSLGRSKLYQLMSAGDLEFVKIGKRRLVTATACQDLLTRHVVTVQQ